MLTPCVLLAKWTFPSLINATLEDLQQGLHRGCFNSFDLVNAYQERIRQVQGKARAVTEINPDALAIATFLDKERNIGGKRLGPLHGIPILLKDNVATMDKMNNTAGSTLLLGAKVPHDSTVARKLREAGAIILGKANMDEWADFRTGVLHHGYSPYGGQTHAAGVSADLGLAFAAIGTDTGGSISFPSSFNGIVGIKPTVGLVSRYLVIPASEHRDSVGPMARTVRDAAHVLKAIAGPDSADNYTSAIPFGTLPDYVEACDEKALQGARIGVPYNVLDQATDLWKKGGPWADAFHKALKIMKDAGATIVEANFTRAGSDNSIDRDDSMTLGADLMTDLPNYFAQLIENSSDIHTLADLRNRTRNAPAEENNLWGTSVWDDALDKFGFNNTDPRFWPSWQRLQQLQGPDGLLGALERHNLTAIVSPTIYAPKMANFIGASVVTVPLGHFPANTSIISNTDPKNETLVMMAPSIPFAMSFVGRHWSEAELIGLAYSFEQKTRVRGEAKRVIMPEAEITVSSCYA
ncbi:amidase domain-containing protein [Hirsutella rhossiliensis]|uniref:Amidase domain-containing protein n=1 Tax=Hirsutella rhossiliensis TaxID=111463 RepID=A0A9P8MNG8_9HYPO|nr:amidase domain-containing protein [Hirsutella rhossiliensis]KAH0957629.1 amidase domain-containing protein [Hirsutella rhossiliensis]